jgi:hypothetical protein
MANETRPQFPRLNLVTQTGRLVAGDLTKKSEVGHDGKKRETPQYYFALAVSKQQPGVTDIMGKIFYHTVNSYGFAPNIAALANANQLPGPYVPEPQRRPFAWKVQDGDWPSNVQKEGHAGCWIFHFQTSGSFQISDIKGDQVPLATIHLGMHAMVSFNTAINGRVDANCGIYLNPTYVRIVADGPIIVPAGQTFEQAFADAPAPILPPGAVAFVAGGGSAQPTYGAPAAAPPYQPAAAAPLPLPAPAPAAPPPPPPPPAPAAPVPLAEQVAAQYGVQHHPGYRYDPVSNSYKPDQLPGNPPPAPPAAVPAVPAGASAPPAPYTGAPNYQATASPTNPGYPPVQPHTAFTQGR